MTSWLSLCVCGVTKLRIQYATFHCDIGDRHDRLLRKTGSEFCKRHISVSCIVLIK